MSSELVPSEVTSPEIIDLPAFEYPDGPSLKKAIEEVPENVARFEVPDCVWPTDNEAGIPLLDINKQADAIDLPVNIWGARLGRTALTRLGGTVLFYTEDYRFVGVWKNPTTVIRGRLVNAGEVNYSVYTQMPPTVALYQTYKKRWLARYWQQAGLKIIVDLNVASQYWKMNLLGVPHGWRAYSTRGYTSRLDALEIELQIACTHAGTEDVIFVVYGGGRKVREWCMVNAHRHVIWIPEDLDIQKGIEEPFNGEAMIEASVDGKKQLGYAKS